MFFAYVVFRVAVSLLVYLSYYARNETYFFLTVDEFAKIRPIGCCRSISQNAIADAGQGIDPLRNAPM